MMGVGVWSQMRRSLAGLFPERSIYLRRGGSVRVLRLTTRGQAVTTGLIAAVFAGAFVSTGLMVVGIAWGGDAGFRSRSDYEALIVDRQARLNAEVTRFGDGYSSLEALARSVQKRHDALALLVADLRGQPAPAAVLIASRAVRSPAEQVEAVANDQNRLVLAAEDLAKARADRLRLAFRMAGVEPTPPGRGQSGVGGPMIDDKDPRALAAVLDVDVPFAARIQHALADVGTAQSLSSAVRTLPVGEPVADPQLSSGFGVRHDPFTGRTAFHAGQDFAGGMMTPIKATAPGVVAFVGQRVGYGNVVEIDHGQGFKTRYAHLARAAVAVGDKVQAGELIARMGSTGRSTGPHLHYEVWRNGRVQDPSRFLKAGAYVQQDQSS